MYDAGAWNLGAEFALRTPLLALDQLTGLSDDLAAPRSIGAGDPELERALLSDRQAVRARLIDIVRRPEVREAMFVASPDLEDVLDAWLLAPESSKAQKTERSVFKYVARMATRSTPFGLFAGCSIGTVAARSALILEDVRQARRVTRLDMDYVYALCEELRKSPLGGELSYRPNSSAYRIAGRWRYAEGRLGPHQTRSYHLVGVDDNEYLTATLTRALPGATAAVLVAALAKDDPEISVEEAREFVQELVDCQMLVPELMPAVTGADAVPALIEALRAYPAGKEVAEPLARANAMLARIDAAPLGVDRSAYEAVAEELMPLPTKVNLARLFQVDMARLTRTATLGEDVAKALIDGVELLRSVGVGARPQEFEAFAEAFERRYEAEEVPLVEAIDEDFGVAFGGPGRAEAPLLEGVASPAASVGQGGAFDGRDTFLLRALLEATRTGATEIELGKEDIAALAPREPMRLPDAVALKATLLASSPADLGAGSFRVLLESVAGPSGARWLGRFCHLDPAIRETVEAHVRAEEALRPDAIFAEIVHLPQGRLGNVTIRPTVRDYELPFLCRPSVPEERQVPISDLMVSVREGRVHLRSRRFDREVLPRMTNMHAFHNPNNLPLYRFLTMLQEQGMTTNVGFGWGMLGSARFLPRITSGKYVLARATWNLSGTELEPVVNESGIGRYRAMQELRATRALPRWIVVADGDQTLPFDLDNVVALDTFAVLIKARPTVRIEELLPSPDTACVEGPDGRYRHELVALLTRAPTDSLPRPPMLAPARSAETVQSVRRAFLPGSEWLYAKIYTGSSTADHVLREVIAPLIEEATGSGAIDRWFFLRYGDPDWHIRLRLHGAPDRLTTDVLPALQRRAAALHASRVVTRVELATYNRELERYGATTIELAEELFRADSRAVLGMLALMPSLDTNARWQLGLMGVDRLFSDLGFGSDARAALLEHCRAGGRAMHRLTDAHDPMFGARYRKERSVVEALLSQPLPPDHPICPCVAHFETRSNALAPIAAELRAREAAGTLVVPLVHLAQSYAHMHLNRLLHASATLQEAVLYDFLWRAHASRSARERKSSKARGQS
jgi:thiopeptide-type bacteriocin biosynthesis protein